MSTFFQDFIAKKEKLNEAARRSLARIHNLSSNIDINIAILTAFRNSAEADPQEIKLPLTINRMANKRLEADLRSLGWGITPIMGNFIESVRKDGKETGEKRKVREESFFCVDKTNSEVFKSLVIGLLNKYNQQAAIIKEKGTNIAVLIEYNGNETIAGKWNIYKLGDFYSKMRKGPVDRKFIFE